MTGELGAFGKYHLVRRLGFGGMAEVFEARLDGQHGFSRRVCLKRILPEHSADPGFVRMFVDEAVISARLVHPNIAQVFDFGQVEGVHYLVMELVDGVDLRRLLVAPGGTARSLGFAEVAALGEGLCRALAHAHAAVDAAGKNLGIVHRDVTPHNIMVSRAGVAKLMDFGIARAEARLTRTGTGAIKGKLAYMSPEQAAGSALDGRSDQYSLGAVLWECVVGERLFGGVQDLELLGRVRASAVRPVASARRDVPEGLARVIDRMLQMDRSLRYPSLTDAERELERYRFSLGAEGVVDLGRWVSGAEAPAVSSRHTRVLPAGPSATAPPASGTPTASVGSTTMTLEPPVRRERELPPPVLDAAQSAGLRPTHAGAGLLGAVLLALLAWELSRPPRGVAAPTEVPRSTRANVEAPEESPPAPAVVVDAPETRIPVDPSPPGRRRTPARPDGSLSLRVESGWYDVFVGGRLLGTTPLEGVPLPAGRQVLELVNGPLGERRLLDVVIPAGGELRRRIGSE